MAAEAVFTAAGRLAQRVRAQVDRSEAQVLAESHSGKSARLQYTCLRIRFRIGNGDQT